MTPPRGEPYAGRGVRRNTRALGRVRIILHHHRLIHPQQDLPDQDPLGSYFIIAVCRDLTSPRATKSRIRCKVWLTRGIYALED